MSQLQGRARAEAIRDIFARHVSHESAMAEVRACGLAEQAERVRKIFGHYGFGAPSAHLGRSNAAARLTSKPERGPGDATVQGAGDRSSSGDVHAELFRLTKRGPVSFEALCDKLDMSPTKARRIIQEARDKGMLIHVENDHVAYHVPDETDDGRVVHDVGIPPVVGETQTIAVISDLHLGSKYCLRPQLREFIRYAYDRGIRKVLCPGDVLEGMYRHAMFEVTHVGLDAQTEDLLDTLPNLPGLSYHCIAGNHDFTFTDHSGTDVGRFIENEFKRRGRNDIKFYGNRSAFLRVCGAKVHLWHPKKGVGYARTYALQKQVEKYSSSEKPQILLTGHWHVHATCFERGVHAIACPTFQGGGSAFAKSLGGAPSIGGLILSWDITAGGTLRNFVLEYRAYFERERWHEVGEEEREELEVA